MGNGVEPRILAAQNRESMQVRLWSTLGAAGVARWTRSLDGSFQGPQPSWSKLTGQTQSELAGFGWLDVVHPDDRDCVRSYWAQGAKGGVLGYRLRDAAGTWRKVKERKASFDDAGELLPQTSTIIEDVGALRQAQQRLRLALEGGRMGTWDIDLSTGTMKCSEQCKSNYGRPSGAKFTYEDLAASVHPDDFERWRAVVAQAIECDSEFGIDYRTVWPDGSVHWVYVRGNCAFDEQGRATTLSGISLDVTDRKRAQQLEQERADAAMLESRKKSEFLAILAHELRGPLGPVVGALQALQMRGDNPKDREWLRALAERQVAHMVNLIDDLLDIARVERGEIRLRLEQIDLRTPLRLAIEACSALMESRGQSFQEAGFDCPITAMVDSTRIAQMASNLLNNAAKYTPPRGHIRLELSQREGRAEICVIDDGIGLDTTALERVFNMFEQVENQKAHAQGGLGIGLALTRHLVQLHGGVITVQSEGIGCGCRFSIVLPLEHN
ncbi:sensor histidine kinase [Noviherbaspirillum pedocola]|uniref:histidine kinase n=1 Tax=Noviherbaspirillum pedocola TaxID=2801341 RepID=A0A934W7F1_9BURK|nr:HAMP domain-containing sensor histidine kinase [Noviherbaspirillum pedocola]MBK4735508.1 PAS domain-containing protein [Noviherbaspirillum pedocola]